MKRFLLWQKIDFLFSHFLISQISKNIKKKYFSNSSFSLSQIQTNPIRKTWIRFITPPVFHFLYSTNTRDTMSYSSPNYMLTITNQRRQTRVRNYFIVCSIFWTKWLDFGKRKLLEIVTSSAFLVGSIQIFLTSPFHHHKVYH